MSLWIGLRRVISTMHGYIDHEKGVLVRPFGARRSHGGQLENWPRVDGLAGDDRLQSVMPG